MFECFLGVVFSYVVYKFFFKVLQRNMLYFQKVQGFFFFFNYLIFYAKYIFLGCKVFLSTQAFSLRYLKGVQTWVAGFNRLPYFIVRKR